jgi:hypothetical protein
MESIFKSTYSYKPVQYVYQLVPTDKNGFCFEWHSVLEDQNNLIVTALRIRHLLSKFIYKWAIFHRAKIVDLTVINDHDLCNNSFSSVPYIEIVEYGKIFRFSCFDITNLFTQSLLQSSYMMPNPSTPKNPYTNKKFNPVVLSQLYKFACDHRAKVPEIMVLYKLSHFDISSLSYRFGTTLDYNACRNHTDELFEGSNMKRQFERKINILLTYVSDELADIPTKNKVRRYCQYNPISDGWKSLISKYLYIRHYLTTVRKGRVLILNNELYSHHLTHLVTGLTSYSKIITESFQISKGKVKNRSNQEVFHFRAYPLSVITNNRNSSRRRRSRPLVIGEGIDITFDANTSTPDTEMTDETTHTSNITDTNTTSEQIPDTEPESDNSNLDINTPDLIPLPVLTQGETAFFNLLLLSENSTYTGTRPE